MENSKIKSKRYQIYYLKMRIWRQDCYFNRLKKIYFHKNFFKNKLQEEQDNYDDLNDQNKTMTKELNDLRQKLSILAKENEELRKKLVQLELANKDPVIGKYVSNGSANGRIVYQGLKGGRYYFTKKGTKSYLSKGDVVEQLSSDDDATFWRIYFKIDFKIKFKNSNFFLIF